jgi:uncharacterized protein
MNSIEALPLRLVPGDDLRTALETAAATHAGHAIVVVSGIGSLDKARVRLAGMTDVQALQGDLEILTLSGTVAINGSHLHMSISDSQGHVIGGHVAHGCTVRTTAEVLLLILKDWSFTRELDPATGFAELVIRNGST